MSEDKKTGNGRRRFCELCIGGMTAATAGTVAFPVVTFLGMPVKVGNDKPVEFPLAELVPGQVKYVELRGEQLVVLAMDDGPLVFASSCPHLGCSVIWDAAEQLFRCPCHGAIFSTEGTVVSGPVSSPLKKIPFEIKEDKIIIS